MVNIEKYDGDEKKDIIVLCPYDKFCLIEKIAKIALNFIHFL